MSPDEAIAKVAAKQHGVCVRAQALRAGITPDMIRTRTSTGRWHVPFEGVYVVAGAPPTWEQRTIAAVFAYGAEAAASHVTAAHLLGMHEEPPSVTHVSLGRNQKRRRRPGVVPHQATLGRGDVRLVHGIRTTTANRTLVDVAGILSFRGLEAVLDDAIQLGLTTLPRLARYIVDRNLTHNKGAADLRRLINDRSEGAMHKALERMFRRKLEATDLPKAKRQLPLGRYKIDFAWPDHGVAVELDGLGGHFSAERSRYGKRRDRYLLRHGMRPVHFSWEDVDDDWQSCEADLRALLTSGHPRAQTPRKA
jgi:very-short-patch-repair endonuclease